MASGGANIESIRELNKIRIYAYNVGTPASGGAVSEIKGTSTEIFSAYLTQSIGSFTAGVQVSSLMEQFAKWVNGAPFIGKALGGVVSKVVQQQTNSSLAFNYDYNYQFTGTPQFTKTFACELVTKNDFYDDVAQPLWNLLQWLVPDEGAKLADTADLVKLGQMIETNTDLEGKKLFEREWIADIAQFLWETANEYFGGITFYQIPKQFNHDARLRVCIGNWIVIENIILDSVTFDIPYLMYEDGLFDRVGLTLSLKGTRNTSIRTYDWVKDIANRTHSNPNIPVGTLNSQFTTKPPTKQKKK